MFVISKYGKNKDKSSWSRGHIETIIQAQKGLAGPHISLAASFCAKHIWRYFEDFNQAHFWWTESHCNTWIETVPDGAAVL